MLQCCKMYYYIGMEIITDDNKSLILFIDIVMYKFAFKTQTVQTMLVENITYSNQYAVVQQRIFGFKVYK